MAPAPPATRSLEGLRAELLAQDAGPSVRHDNALGKAPDAIAGFKQGGFQLHREQICKGCKAIARKGCCSAYSSSNRTLVYMVFDAKLSAPQPTSDADHGTSSPMENELRAALEAHGVAMPKARPQWLQYPLTGALLELDFYDAPRRLAIEYDGCQHYEFPNLFHKTRREFDAQVARDRWKDAACAEAGVRLVRIRASGCGAADAGAALAALGRFG